MEVGVAFLIAHFFDHAFNAYHALQLHPMELQSRIRVARQGLALAAAVVGVPDDAAGVIPFDQHHAGGRAQVAAHGGQRHGIGFGNLASNGFLKPAIELLERVSMRGVLIEFGTFVAFAKVGNGCHARSIGRVRFPRLAMGHAAAA